MAWLEKVQIHNITNKLYDGTEYFDDDGIKIITDEVKEINKFYKLNKSERIIKSVPASVLDDETNSGWDFEKWTHKETRATVSKPKPSSVKFENEVWCMFYELGIRYLNYDSKFELPFEKNATGKKQIDVVAIDTQNKIVFLVECKASEKSSASGVKQTKSFKAEIEALKITVRNITTKDIRDRKLEKNLKGVVITNISNKSVVAGMLREGDIIIEVQKNKVLNSNQLNKLIESIYKKGEQTLLLTIINSNNQRRYLGVKTN